MKEKILVVDDEKILLKTLDRLLSKEGYQVTTTDNSYDALDMVKKEFFDLIILDIRMPGMDGISLLKEIRKIQGDEEKSMVIIITGYASEDAPIKAIKLGADDYIMKPFELDDFLHSVNKNIRLCRLEKEKRRYLEELKKSRERYKNLVKSLTRVIWVKTGSKDLEEDIRRILSGFDGWDELQEEWKKLDEEWKKLDEKERLYKEEIMDKEE
ncbi:MAG TPA: response regulator [Candidatus Altiarchaeales archaeon]|nr:response regulator [Candidatus Altiarchaeales archaeon]